MADLVNYKIQWKIVPRPWGLEIRYNAVNLITGHIWQEVISAGEKEPDEKQVEALISAHLDRCEQMLNDMAANEEAKRLAEIEFPKLQAEACLKSEGILKENETIESLKTAIAELSVLKAESVMEVIE